jgi:hypothetical protein
MKALFQVPKDAVPAKKKPAKSGLRRPANAALPANFSATTFQQALSAYHQLIAATPPGPAALARPSPLTMAESL